MKKGPEVGKEIFRGMEKGPDVGTEIFVKLGLVFLICEICRVHSFFDRFQESLVLKVMAKNMHDGPGPCRNGTSSRRAMLDSIYRITFFT